MPFTDIVQLQLGIKKPKKSSFKEGLKSGTGNQWKELVKWNNIRKKCHWPSLCRIHSTWKHWMWSCVTGDRGAGRREGQGLQVGASHLGRQREFQCGRFWKTFVKMNNCITDQPEIFFLPLQVKSHHDKYHYRKVFCIIKLFQSLRRGAKITAFRWSCLMNSMQRIIPSQGFPRCYLFTGTRKGDRWGLHRMVSFPLNCF